jgi:hypothetical protein
VRLRKYEPAVLHLHRPDANPANRVVVGVAHLLLRRVPVIQAFASVRLWRASDFVHVANVVAAIDRAEAMRVDGPLRLRAAPTRADEEGEWLQRWLRERRWLLLRRERDPRDDDERTNERAAHRDLRI